MALAAPAAMMMAGTATSLIGQSQASENADDALAAQKQANASNVLAQRATDRANWAKYLQSTGINMGTNPFYGDPESQPYVPVKLYPWMTEKVQEKLTQSELADRNASAKRIADYNAETESQNAAVDKMVGVTGTDSNVDANALAAYNAQRLYIS